MKLTKQVYKGLNIEGEYTFSAGNNSMKYGISYAGHAGNGGYKFTLLPVSHKGKNIDVIISASQKIGKNGSVNAFVDVDFLNKSFYGETEYVQSLGANLALFAQARYGGLIKEPFVQGVA
ncbi:MAG: hypothetical protein LBU27_08650 [Candidatus Peribacteria bacterium]|nr:hypothetical protein [Candidatus Peribacteria bacterium]